MTMAQKTSSTKKKTTKNPKPLEVQSDQSSLSWKIFNAFIEGSELSATEEELREYAVEELKLNVLGLPDELEEHIPLILIAYMNNWTGWMYKQQFLEGKFQKQHYFNRFRKYLMHKMKYLGSSTNFNKKTMKSLGLEEKFDNKQNSGMNSKAAASSNENLEFSSYALSIQCTPNIINTIVFSNSGDDIILKQHLGLEWRELSTAQLVNWPNVEVSFKTQDLYFVRKQATEYLRYLNVLPHESKNFSETVVESVESTDKCGTTRNCYTYRFLEEYIKEYMMALKTIRNITGKKLEEIQTILSQFLEDIKHINIKNSIATNTVVVFRLSRVPFMRNKKLVNRVKPDNVDKRVGYCEIITPKVELILLYFRAQQKDTPHISFELTDKIKNTIIPGDITSMLPYVGYKCTFCRIEFNTGNTKEQLLQHLHTEHSMEQQVRCTKCKKSYDIMNLTACRWRHLCNSVNSTVPIL